MNTKIKSILKNIIALALILALFSFVNIKELFNSFANLTILQFSYLMFISIVLVYISALKWSLFLSSFSSPNRKTNTVSSEVGEIPVLRLFNLYLVGYFVNLLLPSFLGGDAVRSWYVGKKVGQHEAAAATILERYTGFAAMILLASGFIWFVKQANLEIKLLVGAAFAGLIVITFIGLSTKVSSYFLRYQQIEGVMKHFKKIQDAFHLAKKDRPLLYKTFALSLLFHSVTVINTIACAQAVDWMQPPIWDLFVVLPIILLIAAIPLAPNGLGLQEGAFFFFLTGLGATPEQALGTALILRAKSYVLAIAGGLIWLYLKFKDKKA
ncbi:MAG: flippase-like domain-containing protein [Bdellovibrionales bacterium]|nr:flippase-like domain-containing protein [Bdellovibrionales bacterium]